MKSTKTILIAMTIIAAGASVVVLPSCEPASGANTPKVIIIGFDGMDPRLCEKLMDAGKLPRLDMLRKAGGYKPLGTSIPPQSPVAWASFITGANPGVHGIFDFIHRDPSKQCAPYYSAAQTEESDDGWEVGEHKLPLTFWPFNHQPTQTLLKRGGTPFWDYLDEAGISTRIYDIPANYPPSESKHGHMCCLSGMGVPDLLGSYGTYQYFSEDTFSNKNEGGGMRKPLIFVDNAASSKLIGPKNAFLLKPKDSEVPFTIYRHPEEKTARIEIQGKTIVLKEGEWSDWIKVEFDITMPPFLPNEGANGICRFYVQEVRPNFRLYVTPINIDPSDPADQIITEPPEFITEISKELGLFHTAGFQEDHKALSNKVFTDPEFLEQARFVLEERMELMNYALKHYEDGLLFFYFSSTDLQGHMFWWDSDEPHPLRPPAEARKYQQVVEDLYVGMDKVVGQVVDRYGDDATIMVMSDHGFCNFRRQFNLNHWLRDNGYLQPSNCRSLLNPARRPMVDWHTTTAYGLGLNGLYLNLQGRERDGIVDPAKREALLDEIIKKLLAVRDPQDGRPVIATVYKTDEIYSGPFVETAPDLIVGYHRDFRVSWASTLGDISKEIIADNNSAWSADHCIAADQVPGVIFSNRPIARLNPSLVDMAPTVLELFNVTPTTSMEGGSLFTAQQTALAEDNE